MRIKICTKCGIEKPLTEFSFRKDTDKYHNACKVCINNQARKRYDKRVEEFIWAGFR